MVERVQSKRRRVMRDFRITELSAVDSPAQKHALAVLMKRDDSVDNDVFDKAGGGNPNHDPKSGEFTSGPGGGGSGGGESQEVTGTDADGGELSYTLTTSGNGVQELLPEEGGGWLRASSEAGLSSIASQLGYKSTDELVAEAGAKSSKELVGKWIEQGGGEVTLLTDSDLGIKKSNGDYPQAASIAQAVEAMDFDEILAESEASELAREVSQEMRSKWAAMQQSFDTIARDESLAPGKKIRAMQGSLRQFIDSLSEQSAEIGKSFTKSLTAVPELRELLKQNGSEGDTPMTEAEKKQLVELQKSVTDLTSKLEAATAKEPAKKAADLQGELDEITEKLEKSDAEKAEASTLAKMSDAEKAFAAGLGGADKMKFMQMSLEDKKKAMAKSADADPVVYKSESSGEEFRKSDDPRLVKMAKAADEDRKIAKEERAKRETSELSKRADDELKYISDDVAKREDKIEVLRAIEKMDDGPKAALLKMLSVGGKAISAAFDRIGHSNEGVSKSARDFEKRVTEVMARDKISKLDAMDKAAREFPAEFDAYQATGVQISN